MKWLPTFTLLVLIAKHAHSYIVTIDAHAEECFYDNAETKSKLSLSFIVMEGGFSDIDVRIIGPDDKIIYEGVQENSGKNTFVAYMNGAYRYCFSNVKSTMTPKVVMFNMEVEEAPKHNESHSNQDEDGNHDKLDQMIRELSASLIGVKTEQEYMQVRDANHRAINENTNFRVGMWSMFEAFALICMTGGQIYYLRRFFEVRRVV